jgi:hypothetical protein
LEIPTLELIDCSDGFGDNMKVVSLLFKSGGVFILSFIIFFCSHFQMFRLVVIEGIKGELKIILEEERIQPFLNWCVWFINICSV